MASNELMAVAGMKSALRSPADTSTNLLTAFAGHTPDPRAGMSKKDENRTPTADKPMKRRNLKNNVKTVISPKKRAKKTATYSEDNEFEVSNDGAGPSKGIEAAKKAIAGKKPSAKLSPKKVNFEHWEFDYQELPSPVAKKSEKQITKKATVVRDVVEKPKKQISKSNKGKQEIEPKKAGEKVVAVPVIIRNAEKPKEQVPKSGKGKRGTNVDVEAAPSPPAPRMTRSRAAMTNK